jgi:hypothetical protein
MNQKTKGKIRGKDRVFMLYFPNLLHTSIMIIQSILNTSLLTLDLNTCKHSTIKDIQ